MVTESLSKFPPDLKIRESSPFDRLLDIATRLGEKRLTQVVAGLQLPIFAHFMSMASERTPWWNAAMYPIAAPLGFVNPIVDDPKTLTDFLLVAEPMEMVAVGAGALATTGLAIIRRFQAVGAGEIPIHKSNAVLFLNAGSRMPAAEAYGKRITTALTREGKKPGNLHFAALYAEEAPHPTNPKGFNRHWFAHPVDLQMNVTDTDILAQTGAFEASVIILMGDNPRIIEDTAITIISNRETPVRIIPLPTSPTSFEPYATLDLDTQKKIELTEKPINPFRFLAEKVATLYSNNPKLQEQTADYFTEGIVPQKRQKRKERVLEKIGKFSHGGKVYLNGETGDKSEERKGLEKAFAGNVVDTMVEADIIISYGTGDVANDLSVSDDAERMKDEMFDRKITDKLHLFLTYSQGNEDSAGEHAEAGASIQRLMAQELVERTREEIVPPTPIREIARGLVGDAIHRISGVRIRNALRHKS